MKVKVEYVKVKVEYVKVKVEYVKKQFRPSSIFNFVKNDVNHLRWVNSVYMQITWQPLSLVFLRLFQRRLRGIVLTIFNGIGRLLHVKRLENVTNEGLKLVDLHGNKECI